MWGEGSAASAVVVQRWVIFAKMLKDNWNVNEKSCGHMQKSFLQRLEECIKGWRLQSDSFLLNRRNSVWCFTSFWLSLTDAGWLPSTGIASYRKYPCRVAERKRNCQSGKCCKSLVLERKRLFTSRKHWRRLLGLVSQWTTARSERSIRLILHIPHLAC